MADDSKPEDQTSATTPDAEDVRARAVREAEEMAALTPTPTQAELDQVKLNLGATDGGKAAGYKTRQARAN